MGLIFIFEKPFADFAVSYLIHPEMFREHVESLKLFSNYGKDKREGEWVVSLRNEPAYLVRCMTNIILFSSSYLNNYR